MIDEYDSYIDFLKSQVKKARAQRDVYEQKWNDTIASLRVITKQAVRFEAEVERLQELASRQRENMHTLADVLGITLVDGDEFEEHWFRNVIEAARDMANDLKLSKRG